MLTRTEKKCLYRISFCQTLAEVTAPTGEWKLIIGSALISISVALWLYMLVVFMVQTELPETFEPERQVAQLKRMIDLRVNPIDGISSKWDYDNNNWKGLPPKTPKKKERKPQDDDE
ncbi:unnamed protein product [Nesidiocoris tenuis]|uniref:Cytochrome c oxidase subunit 4 n=1 Tax=Nesidiocoris tenuis TaxID=355587 RepID=A0A6H5HDH1_9HEMI|nr:unnamed protein product [Nesidiocoris tenuis]CAB0014070.1 unnamed protein product [Nesidiocoris tenuis]